MQMTGSCVLSEEYWEEAVGVLLDAVAEVHSALGISFEFINVGGGLGIPYRPSQPRVDVTRVAARLRAVVDAKLKANPLPVEPALYMENGRYMTGPFGWLVARCQAVKVAYGTRYYGLDACMANLMRPGMYGAYHHVTVPARETEGAERAVSHVVGTLCENNDWFARDRDLPVASVGDLFVIHDTGAHAHSMGFQYNGKLRAPELLLRRADRPGAARRVDVIRDRETIHCLYDNTHVPADLLPQRDGADHVAAAQQQHVASPWPYEAGRPPPPPAAMVTPAVLAYATE